LVRNDTAIDFVWGTGSPADGVPADGFSVRWSRQQPFRDGTYRFEVGMDDGARFWIDGRLVVDDWQNGPFRPHSFERYLSEGEHALVLEYYEDLGDAEIELAWSGWTAADDTHAQLTPSPTATPTPTEPPPASEPWRGRYYDNPELHGEPAMRRQDAELNFACGAGSPGEAIPVDEFSVRWTRDLNTSRCIVSSTRRRCRVWVTTKCSSTPGDPTRRNLFGRHRLAGGCIA
jgi:hypothetical protein